MEHLPIQYLAVLTAQGRKKERLLLQSKKKPFADNRRVTLEYRATKVRLASDHYAVANGASFVFRLEDDIRVVRSSDNWVGGATFIVRRGSNATGDGGPYNSSNPFVPNHPQAGNNFCHQVLSCKSLGSRKLQKNRGRSQGYYHEIFGNAESKNFGDTATEVRNLSLGTRGGSNMKLSLRLKSSVVHHSDHWTGRSKFWATPTIEVVEEKYKQRWEQMKYLMIWSQLAAQILFTITAETAIKLEFVIELLLSTKILL